MILVDIEKLDYETFDFGDEDNPILVDYISAKDLMDAPHVDPVNHAKLRIKIDRSYSNPDRLHISSYCDCCRKLDTVDIIPEQIWINGYRDTYKPDHSNFCRDCGCKFDKGYYYECLV